ncbi:hypothetical protein AB0I28_31290 [Phytomonospora sp. NPDC050363]|uniref:hypothetical protein n=1 Tax=Phytomonospora sp. NPDC050363 TaxID=3155642 RepID=UPI0033E94AC6
MGLLRLPLAGVLGPPLRQRDAGPPGRRLPGRRRALHRRPEVAAAALDEWFELDAFPQHFEYDPAKRELLGPGRTLAFEAADTGERRLADLTGELIAWRKGEGEAAVTVRAPLTELLLLIYRRRPVQGLAVTGDAALLDLWLGHAAFG